MPIAIATRVLKLDSCGMTAESRNFPQFFITAPGPCPYLPGQEERKVFTHLLGPDPRALNSQLSQGGFRRSQNIAYRPGCESCNACSSVRVPVKDFEWTQSFRRVLKDNADLVAGVKSPLATQEHYDLFRSYIDTRHADGGMADMSVIDFAAMIDETMVETRLFEYRYIKSHPKGGQLAAAVLVDVLHDGLSLIYSFFEPDEAQRSLGTFVVLDCLKRAQSLNLTYLYLGFLVQGSRKMAYKARFLPQERLGAHGWQLHKRYG